MKNKLYYLSGAIVLFLGFGNFMQLAWPGDAQGFWFWMIDVFVLGGFGCFFALFLYPRTSPRSSWGIFLGYYLGSYAILVDGFYAPMILNSYFPDKHTVIDVIEWIFMFIVPIFFVGLLIRNYLKKEVVKRKGRK
jgi:uncharacterized membrane protein